MKKIKLELESLEVESFATDEGEEAVRGTVHGHLPRSQDIFCVSRAPSIESDLGSCGGSCAPTCVEYYTCVNWSCYYTECAAAGCPVGV
jgi:hypothetical protein